MRISEVKDGHTVDVEGVSSLLVSRFTDNDGAYFMIEQEFNVLNIAQTIFTPAELKEFGEFLIELSGNIPLAN